MPKTVDMQGDRAYGRLLCKHIKSRGERRRLWKRMRAVRVAARSARRDERAEARRAGLKPSTTVIKLRSWKQCSHVATPGGALWLRGRVNLKRYGDKRQRCLQGTMESNAIRHQRVLDGELLRVTDEHSPKIRYIKRGLAKKLMRAGIAGGEAK